MSRLEGHLRTALRREEPSPELAERVLSSITSQSLGRRKTIGSLFRMPVMRWAIAGVFTIALLATGVVQYQRERRSRAEGELAKAQLMQALHVASVKLNTARKKVHEIGHGTSRSVPSSDEEGSRVKG